MARQSTKAKKQTAKQESNAERGKKKRSHNIKGIPKESKDHGLNPDKMSNSKNPQKRSNLFKEATVNIEKRQRTRSRAVEEIPTSKAETSDDKVKDKGHKEMKPGPTKTSEVASTKRSLVQQNISTSSSESNVYSPSKPNIQKLTKKIAELKESNTDKKKSPKKSKCSAELRKQSSKGSATHQPTCYPKDDMDCKESADDDVEDSDMEWEDVAEVEMADLKFDNGSSPQDDNSPSTSQNVEVIISVPGKKKKSGQWDRHKFRKWFELKFNKYRRKHQIYAHKVHLLTLLAIGLRKNNFCNNLILQAVALSLLPRQLIQHNIDKRCDIPYLMKLSTWVKNKAPLPGDIHTQNSEATYLMRVLEKKIYLLVVLLRALRLPARLVMSLQPLSMKLTDDKAKGNGASGMPKPPSTPASDSKTKPTGTQKTKKAETPKTSKIGEPSTSSKTPRTGKSSKNRPQRKQKVLTESEYFKETDSASSDEDFDIKSSKTPAKRRKTSPSGPDLRNQPSTSQVKKSTLKKGVDIWVEVYALKEKKWICIDGEGYTLNKPEECEKHATSPIRYIVAFDDDNCVKDVTSRYASGWLTGTQKLRVDSEWWDETLDLYKTRNVKRDKKEDSLLKATLAKKPLPTTVSEFKNHPLYVLGRHLLKFEAIYPETAATLGFCRSEPVYSRDCVHSLHTREIWMKEARVVKAGEKPYKIVKGRKTRKKMLENVGEVTAELFGRWQTEDYVPPPVVDGKIPRNEYGNVELFKPSMLPGGTCHLQVPGIHRLARKLDIDAVRAVVGFDCHGGFTHPIIDGVVVCEEHKETLLEAWGKEQEQKIKREQEKREKRVLDNWRHLLRSLRIRERLKRKYNMEGSEDIERNTKEENVTDATETEDITDLSLSWPLNRQEGKSARADDGHCHVFLEANHVQDAVTGEWSKACSCGLKEPLQNKNT